MCSHLVCGEKKKLAHYISYAEGKNYHLIYLLLSPDTPVSLSFGLGKP